MALTNTDIEQVRALWGEWVGDGWRLEITVEVEDFTAQINSVWGGLAALFGSDSRYIAVRIWRCPDQEISDTLADAFELPRDLLPTEPRLVFDERCPYTAEALRASVKALARAISSATG